MTDTITDRCVRCGKTIELRPVSTKELTFRWYSNTRQTGWRCGDDPERPVQSHQPRRVVLPGVVTV